MGPNTQGGRARADLVRRFCAGDERAARQIYLEYSDQMVAAAHRVLGDRDLAHDAVQQAFLKAWNACDKVDPGRPILPWLVTIARRTAIDIWRRRRRNECQMLSEERTPAPDEGADTWERSETRRAIAQLPSCEREVTYLVHYLGYTHREVSAHLSVPLGTVKSRSNRAYRRLAASLGHLQAA